MVLAALSSHLILPSCSCRWLPTAYVAIGSRALSLTGTRMMRGKSTMVASTSPSPPSSDVRTFSMSAMSSNSSNDSRFQRPKIYQLEHVQKRLEFTTPFMFKSRLDYTFYRKDVVLQDRIFNMERVGIEAIQQHFGVLGVVGQVSFPHIETQILNISPILEDGTVRLRWRIVYLSWFKALDLRNFKLANRLKKAKWYDGYSVFFVDGDGLVYKFTLQKVMPDDSERRNTKKLAEKMGVLPGTTTNFVGSDISSSFGNDYKNNERHSKDSRRT